MDILISQGAHYRLGQKDPINLSKLTAWSTLTLSLLGPFLLVFLIKKALNSCSDTIRHPTKIYENNNFLSLN